MGSLPARDPRIYVGGGILLALIALALIGPHFTSDPLMPDPESILQPPSSAELLGTDNYGRSVLARVVGGAQLDLLIALFAAVLAFVVGSLVGGFTGFAGGLVDDVMMRLVDILQSFPTFLLALGVAAMLGNEIRNVVLAIAVALYLETASVRAEASVVGRDRPMWPGSARPCISPGRHVLPATTRTVAGAAEPASARLGQGGVLHLRRGDAQTAGLCRH